MRLSDFDYYLPKNLIAQEPVRPRDHSRLLVLGLKKTRFEHRHFYDLPEYLLPGDVLVLNNSRVFPARLIGKKKETGGRLEIFLLQKIRGKLWQCLIGGRGAREGLAVDFARGLEAKVVKDNKDGSWEVNFNKSGQEFMEIVNKIGLTPLPPYIDRKSDFGNRISDRKNYQTVYADEKKIGSVAAPTAGLHFTPRLIKKLKGQGVEFEYITLHVGLGTFAPVKVDDIEKHKMHSEYVEVGKNVIKNIIKAKQEGRRVIAVGTTSVRTLEAVFNKKEYKRFITSFRRALNDKKNKIRNSCLPAGTAKLEIRNFSGWVDIFIYPGYKFKIVDGMITNFHLPKSTLLMLVSAFAGKDNIDKAYQMAIKNKYRFYSYGDAMLII